MSFDYDVALSFAGEDRKYVENVADTLNAIGIKVFYDRYEQIDLWGKNLYTHLDDVYQNRAKYCVMFISKHYKEKLWTNHERKSAQARAFDNKKKYILPAKFDETKIPGIRDTVGYIDLTIFSPEKVAHMIAEKINPNMNVEKMITFLIEYLGNYKITTNHDKIIFECQEEEYYGAFSLRLLLEMYLIGELENMFLLPAIIPN